MNERKSEPKASDDFPTDGEEAQKRREKMMQQEKAEGDRRGRDRQQR